MTGSPRLRASSKSPAVAAAKPHRIAEALERDIRSGKLRFGARLESENELVRRFAVSRSTVRKGLEALAGKGLITTRVGIGSFVTFDGQTIDNTLGWTRALSRQKEAVETRLLRLERVRDAELAAALNESCVDFIAIDRTRALSGTGRVISIERSRVPLRPELAHVLAEGLHAGSLAATLRQAGLSVHSGEEWAEVECLGEADAALVGSMPGTPFLRTRRLARDAKGRLLEYVVSLLDPRHFALHLEF
ncbi:GntR family transcriptional regulator [Aestuariivirga sp.]|uniref:GntR family transcriptional regulator n=1 Tax=Aestuariivirga sp. TaxID=2650926 RepID=UPI00391A0549